MKNLVQVIDNISKTVLFETSFDDIEKAYSFALQMEEEGLDIGIIAPGLPETLLRTLHGSNEVILEFKKSLEDEINSHETDLGCAVCLPKAPTL
jgi:predicted TIM-barrel fold metal-dependent hydrolase